MVDAVFPDGSESVFVSTDVLCPTTASICPARENLVKLYEEFTEASIAESLPAECNPKLNGAKLSIRLGEYGLRARAIECDGPTGGICPTRESMNEDRLRKHTVGFIKRIIGRN